MKYKHLISEGQEQSLDTVQFHHQGPLTRYVLMQRDNVDGDGGYRVVTHIINDVPEVVESYCEKHWHEFDEVNHILSEDGSLRYKITLGDETYEVNSPSTVYIPKGLKHSAEVISGKGVFICTTFTKDYKAFN